MPEDDHIRFDGILLSLAEQHKNGVPDVIFWLFVERIAWFAKPRPF